jgi:hypothetical protein
MQLSVVVRNALATVAVKKSSPRMSQPFSPTKRLPHVRRGDQASALASLHKRRSRSYLKHLDPTYDKDEVTQLYREDTHIHFH